MTHAITCEFVDNINRTPAVELAVKGQASILEAGHSDPVVLLNWDAKAIIASIDELPVGVITFSHTKWARQLDVGIGYVEPRFRRHGVYRAMWEALVAKARDFEAKVIFGNTAIGNVRMRDVAAKLGRAETGVILKFTVPSLPTDLPAVGEKPIRTA